MTNVAQLIDQASANTNSFALQANQHLQELLNTTNVQFSDGFNIDQLIPKAYNYASVPTVDFPVLAGGLRPSVDTSAITGPPEAPTIDISAIQDIALPADDLLAPTHQFEFFEVAYSSILLDPLKTKLLNDLQNGGYGIEPADEAALFQRARDREVELATTRVDGAGGWMAARGFSLPPEEQAMHQERAYQDMQNKLSGLERDLSIDRGKRFVENRQFTIREVKDVEQILIGFHNSVQERSLNVARAAGEFAIAIYNALVARQRVRFESAKLAADVQAQRIQAEAARAQAIIEVFRGKIAAYEADLRRLVELTRAQVELYRGDIDANRALTDGLISRATLQQKVLEATVQQNIQISQLTIENAKAKLLATIEALRFKAGGRQFAAGQFFATLTAMAAAVNTLAVQTTAE